jgi:hypothetical protein
VIATALETAPWLMVIGRHRGAVFLGVGGLLALNYWLTVVRPARLNCAPGETCFVDSPAMRLNRRLYWLSVAIYTGAVIFYYAALLWVRMQS